MKMEGKAKFFAGILSDICFETCLQCLKNLSNFELYLIVFFLC